MDRVPIELETFHHVYNRGTDKRQIFMDGADYQRFALYVDLLNNRELENPSKLIENGKIDNYRVKERIVDVCAICLMPNHFHMLLFEKTEGGISKFMQRLGTAYTLYFNERHERCGALFQGVFKSRLIEDEGYLSHVINYIHLNPLALADVSKNATKSRVDCLISYKWSSLSLYISGRSERWLQAGAIQGYVSIGELYKQSLIESFELGDDLTEALGDIAIEE